MTFGRIAYALAVVAVLCVLTVFFFHAIQGPYSVVHGPVTALLSIRAASGLRLSMVRAGLNTLSMWVSFSLILVSWTAAWIADCHAETLPGTGGRVLRC
jgi:hypothetical protein